jgi:hypothetical protein
MCRTIYFIISRLTHTFTSPNQTALEQQQLRGVVLYTRLINLAASIAVIVISVLYFIGSLKDPKIMLLAAYSTCGGCLICCLETQLKFIRTSIAMNFGFLFHALFRFLFYMLIASVCFAFRGIMGYIVGGCLVWVAFWNTYVLIKYPAYRGLRDKLAEEEDKRIEGKMREQIRTEATKQMFSR